MVRWRETGRDQLGGLAEDRCVGRGKSELCSEPRAGAVVDGAADSCGEVCAGCGALSGVKGRERRP